MNHREYRRAWEIAVEYLESIGTHVAHYRDITRYVLQVDQSCLAKMGGTTPCQTMGAVLRSKPHVFVPFGSGFYALRAGR